MTGAAPAPDLTEVARLCRVQARWCADLGSPLYAGLLERVAADIESGGPTALLLAPHIADPPGSALALRLLGAVHRLTLEGLAPTLAVHYPSCGGGGDAAAAWPAFRQVLEGAADRIADLLSLPVQTNEVGRCAALLGGFLTVAAHTGLPLRLLEVGASAGLVMRFGNYQYVDDRRGGDGYLWGRPDSPVVLPFAPPPDLARVPVAVAERRGCDRTPLDARREEDRRTLLSFVWPDQHARFANLRAALELAVDDPVDIDQADASDWIEARLAEPAPGRATVVYHSVVMQYLGGTGRRRFAAILRDAATTATRERPLARLGMELAGGTFEVRLRMWPPDDPDDVDGRLLATCSGHGPPVTWRG